MLDFLAPVWNLIIINPMLNLLLFLYSIIPNYGVAIILFTLIIAGLQSPLRIKSQQTMKETQAKQARLKPKLDELKKKHKDNPQALQAAQMKLYQDEGMNLFNAGCLLQILPLPLFFGLFSVIQTVMGSTPEQVMQLPSHIYPFFKQAAPLVPVNPYFVDGLNLSQAVSTLPIPLIAVIVLLIVGTSYAQQKLMTSTTASLDPQQAQMNQSMQLMMPLMMAFFVYNYQFGLSLYWITFSGVSIVQQALTTGWGGLFGGSGSQKNPKSQKLNASPAASIVSTGVGSNGDEPVAEPTTASSAPQTAVGAVSKPTTSSKKGKKKSGKKY